MSRRILPIPLILLIPIVLLVVVVAAGVYRFSLDDEDILRKQSATRQYDPIMKSVFAINTSNPWTIEVPETSAYAFMDTMTEDGMVTGRYDSGVERGEVIVDSHQLFPYENKQFIAPFVVSNQGSGLFHYIGLYLYDVSVKRLILQDAHLLGDRIMLDKVAVKEGHVIVTFKQHSATQAMSMEPQEDKMVSLNVNEGEWQLAH